MKRTLLSTLLLLCALCVSVQAADEVPDPVKLGLKSYAESNAAIATDVWLKNSYAENAAELKKELLGLGQVERVYGSFEGHDVVHLIAFSSRAKRVYLVLYFERGPAWVYFDVYQKRDSQWVINGARLELNAEEILPETLLRRVSSTPRGR
jgi:hypothetical protein